MTKEEFIQIVNNEQEAVQRFLFALCCGNKENANDLAQETFLKAYLCREQYTELGKAKFWLLRIAYNLFINHKNREQRTKTDSIDIVLQKPSNEDIPNAIQALNNALATISSLQRTAIVLHYIEGYSVQEVAQITNKSESAVKKQLQRGREELKRKIEL